MEKLDKLFTGVFSEGALIKIIFSRKRSKSLPYGKVTVRPVQAGGEIMYQFAYFYEKKVTHRNCDPDSAAKLGAGLISDEFKQANIFTGTADIQVMAARADDPKILRRQPSLRNAAVSHDRQKNYIIPDGKPVDFLIRLGVMDKDGHVFPRRYSKFRQINRYLEIIDDIFPAVDKGTAPVRIIDFGCGKAYLTFAIYYYMTAIRGKEVCITGLDLKQDVIDYCNSVASDLGYKGLKFLCGDIADYEGGSADINGKKADMVVTLHACDTATDYALINAVSWGADVILSVPCCQHELFRQISDDLHRPILKHGILKDRFTEYLTDGLRGLKLESRGYEVSMVEFTSLEHTSKNIMIRAVRRHSADRYRREEAQRQYEALCSFYHVSPTIDQL